MRHLIRLLTLVVVSGVGMTALAADPPPTPTDPNTGEKFDLARPKFVTQQVGKVTKVSGGDNGGTLTIRVDAPQNAINRRAGALPYRDVDLSLTKDVAVRVTKVPPVEDSNGKTRQPTSEELRKAKGLANLPGYTGEFSKVRPDAVVRVFMVQPKRPKDAKQSDPAPTPLVAMISIITEAPAKK